MGKMNSLLPKISFITINQQKFFLLILHQVNTSFPCRLRWNNSLHRDLLKNLNLLLFISRSQIKRNALITLNKLNNPNSLRTIDWLTLKLLTKTAPPKYFAWRRNSNQSYWAVEGSTPAQSYPGIVNFILNKYQTKKLHHKKTAVVSKAKTCQKWIEKGK